MVSRKLPSLDRDRRPSSARSSPEEQRDRPITRAAVRRIRRAGRVGLASGRAAPFQVRGWLHPRGTTRRGIETAVPRAASGKVPASRMPCGQRVLHIVHTGHYPRPATAIATLPHDDIDRKHLHTCKLLACEQDDTLCIVHTSTGTAWREPDRDLCSLPLPRHIAACTFLSKSTGR